VGEVIQSGRLISDVYSWSFEGCKGSGGANRSADLDSVGWIRGGWIAAGDSVGSGFIHSGISVSGAKSVDGFSLPVSGAGVLSPLIHSGMISTGLDCGAGFSCNQSGTLSIEG